MEMKADRIRMIVASKLAERFEGVDIVSVEVHSEKDEDGDDVAMIDAVFDSKLTQLDSETTTSLVRRIRPRLRDFGETAFPVFSFIAKSELGKLKPEAA